MRNSKDIRKEIIKFSEQLIQLNKELKELTIRETKHKEQTNLQGEAEFIKGSKLRIGDFEVIRNPLKDKEDRGEVIGKSKDGLAKIKRQTNKIIRRLPKNLKKHV